MLTPKIRDLIESGRPQPGPFDPDDITALIDVIEGDLAPNHRHLALATLAAAVPPDAGVPVLSGVLADRAATQTDRAAAARGLARLGGVAAQQALLRQAGEPNPRLQQEVLAALGVVADAAAGSVLARLPLPDDPAARRQLAFTRALVTHRHAQVGPFLPAAPARTGPFTIPGEQTAVTIAPADTSAIARDDRLRGTTYGIAPADRGYALRCGTTNWTILPNAQLDTNLATARLFDRPWIAAVLAQQLPANKRSMVRLVVLTRPLGDGLHFDVVRSDGQVAYVGEAHRQGDGNAFTLTDSPRPGSAPTQLSGRVTPAGVELTTIVASAVRVDQQTAQTVFLVRDQL
ncbi:hypothetical protein [Cryptosporangium sp. NPDC051539]|uniref:hypothetical protein n=1 Tax=Cryptosporangium sp. NPDC051539 TaxID=3363962 RepID=UPI0037ADDC06